MIKIDDVKYVIYANIFVKGLIKKSDIIKAIFEQTEGLLGADLDIKKFRKDRKIGRIEVKIFKEGNKTIGNIIIPTALNKSKTTLVAAEIETIKRIGSRDSQIEIERIEDARENKRFYVLERAKKLVNGIKGQTYPTESSISKEVQRNKSTPDSEMRIVNYDQRGFVSFFRNNWKTILAVIVTGIILFFLGLLFF